MKKPPYRIPSLDEIEQLPRNGFSVVSTFTGAGGACLGWKWAGYSPLYASEFVEAARDVYSANFPSVYVDERDIRNVSAEDLLAKIERERGDVDVLEGSPPCAAFSTAGSGVKGWGTERSYSETTQRVDDLFFEFARIVDGVRPRIFVAENVEGLVRGAAKGYFKLILRKLRDCGYRVRAKVLDAQWLGVPQRRKRLIFIGVREDLEAEPVFPKPLPYRYTLRDACPWIVETQVGSNFVSAEKRWERADETVAPTIMTTPRHTLSVVSRPPTTDVDADADISRFAIGDEWKKLRPGEQSEKYFSLLLADPNEPSPTVTSTGGNPSAAGVVLPYEPRKYTIGELRRVCGFPDDFRLLGDYKQQWERLGRAVPPPMARAIGDAVLPILKQAKR